MSFSKTRFIEAVERGKSLRWDGLLKQRASHPEFRIVAPYEEFCASINWLVDDVAEKASDAQLEEYTTLLDSDWARQAFHDGNIAQLTTIIDVWRPALAGA